MQLTLEADYAIRIIIFLIEHKERAGAKKISENTGVTLRVSLKILRKLVANSIVRSYKGSKGGYELNKKAEDINLLEVIESVDCRFVMNKCLEPGALCTNPNSSNCKTKILFSEISSEVKNKLKNFTLDRLV